jgi:hypothetical protein
MPIAHWDDGVSKWDDGYHFWDFATEATQAQSVRLILAVRRALPTVTQSQTLALSKQPRLTRALAQAQSLSLVAQRVFLRTLSASQSQVVTLLKQARLTRGLTEGQALSLLRTASLWRATAQPQVLALQKQAGLTRGLSQAQSLSLTTARVVLRTLSVTQAQATTLVKQVRLIRVLAETQLLNLLAGRSLLRTLALTQAQSAALTFTVIRAPTTYPITVAAGQGQVSSLTFVKVVTGYVYWYTGAFQSAASGLPTRWGSGAFQSSGTAPLIVWNPASKRFELA